MKDFLQIAAFVSREWGLFALARDGFALQKLGLLLVAVPFISFIFLRGGWVSGRQAAYLRIARWVMWAGAAVAALSTLDLITRVDVFWYSAVVLAFGILLPFLMAWWLRREKRRAGFGTLAGFGFLHLMNYATSMLFIGYSLYPFPASGPPLAQDRNDRWRQDILYLGSELPRLHRNAYHTVSPEAFRSEIEGLLAAVPRLSDSEIAVEMMRIVALVGDAHTNLPFQSRLNFHRFPISLYLFSDGLYVMAVDRLYERALGTRLVSLNGVTPQAAIEAISPLIASENESWLKIKLPSYLVSAEALIARGLLDELGSAPFTFEDRQGERFTLEITPLLTVDPVDWRFAAASTPLYEERADEPFWFRYLADEKTMYFKYNRCTDPLGFRKLVHQMWEAVDQNEAERLVVDFRGNGGGNSYHFNLWFVNELKKRPMLAEPGRLFVVVDRGTFSSASDNATTLWVEFHPVIAGEPTGGRPNSYGEVRSFKLPNSRLAVFYSTKYFQMLDEDPPALTPTLPIDVDAFEYFAGHDPVMDAVLGYQE